MSSATTARAQRVPFIVPLLNPIIRRLVGAGMPFGPNVVMTVVGRSSGIPRSFPVAIVEHEGHQYVQSPFGEVNWVQNLRASGEATISKGRSRQTFDAVELAPDDAGRILYAAVSPYQRSRIGAVLVKQLFHLERDATIGEFIAESRKHPTFELRPTRA